MINDVFRLDGKNAIVTGASRGIGKAAALSLARQGANVLLVSRDKARMDAVVEEIRVLYNQKSKACVVDVSDPDQIIEFFEAEVESFGGVDIFVNNAGYSIFENVMDTSLDTFHKLIDTNVSAALLFSQLCAKRMIEKGTNGSIIIVSSVNGVRALPRQAAYSATKAMLESLTASFANTLGPHGIRVNSVLPGAIDTDMNFHFTEQVKKEVGDMMPIRRVGEPHEVGDVIAFLASDAASYMTGSAVVVDGGLLVKR